MGRIPQSACLSAYVLGKNGTMRKSILAAAFMAGALLSAALPAAAQIYVRLAPPTPIVERVPTAPGPGYVWVGGHYNWNGTRYVWVPGHYIRHTGHWCAGGWHHNAVRGWYWTEGHWC
jgi:hypothetical protein